MDRFIGQENLLKTINNYTLATIPHTLLFIGEEGCGKKTVAKYLANKLGIKLVIIDNKVDQDKLIEYQHSAIKTLYLIDLSNFNLEKDQNKFLKFIEEPADSVYIILINTSDAGILPTVANRCIKFRFSPYQIKQLKQIKDFSNELVYKICRTPGQLKNIDEAKIAAIYNTCKDIVETDMPYEKLVSITTKINYKEDYNKFDFETFFNALELVSLEAFTANKNNKALKIYLYTIQRRQALIQNTLISKEPFTLNFFDGLFKELN